MEIIFNDIGVDIRPLAWLILIIYLVIQWRRKQNKSYLFCLLVFWIYILYALQVTFFPLQITGTFVDVMRQNSSWMTDINLIPFYLPNGYFVNEYLHSFALAQFAENILLTIPFGFGVNFVLRTRRKDFFWLPFAVGFGIELAQLLINLILRYPYRVVDITDALLNAAGVVVGYGVFRLFSKVFTGMVGKRHKEPKVLLAFIQKVSNQALED